MDRRNGRRISLGQLYSNQARFLMILRGDRGMPRTPPLETHAAPWGARQPSCQLSARLPCSSLRAESQQSASAERQGVSV